MRYYFEASEPQRVRLLKETDAAPEDKLFELETVEGEKSSATLERAARTALAAGVYVPPYLIGRYKLVAPEKKDDPGPTETRGGTGQG